MRRLFRASTPAGLEMNSIRSADGELGLRVHGTSAYFGLIYVGDAPAFRSLVEEHAPDVETGEEVISGPLFPTVNRMDSDLQMLIGAKKFIEGWDSWRVSSMCLLNVGRSEGSEIIQLFGRGVRLKGMNGSLRRRTAIHGREHPKDIRILERLNIFAVRADYMSQFRDYLEREGVDTGGMIELELPLWNQKKFLNEGLYLPQWPKESTFQDEEICVLAVDEKAVVRHDISARIETIVGSGGTIHDGGAAGGVARTIPRETLALLDWQQIHNEVVAYRETAGYQRMIDAHSFIINIGGHTLGAVLVSGVSEMDHVFGYIAFDVLENQGMQVVDFHTQFTKKRPSGMIVGNNVLVKARSGTPAGNHLRPDRRGGGEDQPSRLFQQDGGDSLLNRKVLRQRRMHLAVWHIACIPLAIVPLDDIIIIVRCPHR